MMQKHDLEVAYHAGAYKTVVIKWDRLNDDNQGWILIFNKRQGGQDIMSKQRDPKNHRHFKTIDAAWNMAHTIGFQKASIES